MSTVAQMIARTEDRWPDAPRGGERARPGAVRVSPARRQPRGRQLRRRQHVGQGHGTDHVGREVPAIWVKGSGSDLATMERKHFTPLRLEEMLPLLEREEMSDEEMVAYLARCQLDPAAPRSSIETLLHAFVPAPHVHHTHPDAINVLAGSRDGEQADRGVLRRRSGVDPVHPARLHARQAGRAGGAREPGLQLVVLAKHGLVVWGDSAEEAYAGRSR